MLVHEMCPSVCVILLSQQDLGGILLAHGATQHSAGAPCSRVGLTCLLEEPSSNLWLKLSWPLYRLPWNRSRPNRLKFFSVKSRKINEFTYLPNDLWRWCSVVKRHFMSTITIELTVVSIMLTSRDVIKRNVMAQRSSQNKKVNGV
jgi:hypothetical protein